LRRRLSPVLGAIALAILASSGGADTWAAGSSALLHGSFTVLESTEHGPELCGSIRESLPPQCNGLPVRNWHWTAVQGAESLNGTTWGTWHVTGTLDGDAFVLTEVPRAAKREQRREEPTPRPHPNDRNIERDRLLAEVQEELRDADARAALGAVPYSFTDPWRGVVVAAVWFADRSAQRFAKNRWGDLVELRSLLEPV
jgi:hypothetical protein